MKGKSAVLAAIADGARNAAAISSRTGLRTGKLYPILAQLEREEKIISHHDGQRRCYEVKK